MIRKYAILNNNIVTSLMDLDIDSEMDTYMTIAKINDMVVDITDINPQPNLSWVLNGNKLEYPNFNSDVEALEEKLAERKVDLGYKLAKEATIRIGARNKILKKSAQSVIQILNQLIGVRFQLEGGSLGGARDSMRALKGIYTEYSDIFDKLIAQIDAFESTYGL